MLSFRWLRPSLLASASRFSTKTNGIDLLRDPHKNKGTAFTIRERQLLGIHGLLPPAEISLEAQVNKVIIQLRTMADPLQRYVYLSALQERNEVLFYRLVIDHVEYIMPLIYTPNVGLACQRFGVIFRRPRGLYITIHDRHHIDKILDNWPEHTVKAIVFTDGERILGLGDLGANGMGIPIGKLSLYTALAGVHPAHCLPVQLDVGTNNKDLLTDSNYMGLKHERIQDERYDELVDNFMKAVVEKYGMNTLIQFEDFANHNAFKLLHRYNDVYCTFNDDIQGTASVAVAGLLAANKLTGRSLSDNVFLFVGAGEAATGIAALLHKALEIEGVSSQESYNKIFMYDKDGLLVKDRPEGNLNDHNIEFAREDCGTMKDIAEIVKEKKITAIIGASGCGGLFTQEVLETIDKNSDHPIIFALSNPTSKAECTAEQAYRATQGRCVFTSGSPFDRVEITVDGETKVFQPGQCNNSYIFPGVGLAITACEIRPVPEEIFVIAANALADQVDEHDLKLGRVFPPLGEIRDVSLAIAERCAEYAYKNNIAHALPQPSNLQAYLKGKMYEPEYTESVPEPYEWPNH